MPTLLPFALMLSAATVAGLAVVTPAISCGQQAKCLTWTVTAMTASHENCGGDCQFEVCALVDTVQCKGSSEASLYNACTADQGICGSDITSAFDEWSSVRLSHQNRLCQVGLGGTTLHFPMNDGQHCVGQMAPLEIGSASQASCAPRTAHDPTCSLDVIDCVWKVTLPACRSGALSDSSLAGLAAGAILGLVAFARLVMRPRKTMLEEQEFSAAAASAANVGTMAQLSRASIDTLRITDGGSDGTNESLTP